MRLIQTAILALLTSTGMPSMVPAQPVSSKMTEIFQSFSIPYIRFALGGEMARFDDSYWDPAGPDDPRVFFDLANEDAVMGTLAMGYDWGKGVRAEIAFLGFGEKDVAGPWSYTVPDTPGPHASMAGTLRSNALMANAYLVPLERQGRTGAFQPFLMAGIGLAHNGLDSWTRTNPDSNQETRSFEGAARTDMAWTLGAGAAWQIGGRGKKPVMLELMYQYIDLGRAEGGSTPLPGSGMSEPREPWGFDVTTNVVSIGIRIPIK